jgi:ribose-phosphate pyrophosphokinase
MENIKLYISGKEYQITKTVFPAGESCIRIDAPDGLQSFEINPRARIVFNFKNNSDLFDLALVVDAARRLFYARFKFVLEMPYLPYARQDRVCNVGESLSVKVVADFINALDFERVICHDIHSPVGAALINNLFQHPLTFCARHIGNYCKPENTAVISPDAGAEKKVFDFAKQLGYDSVIRATKVRNVATGKIERTSLLDPIRPPFGVTPHKEFLIVDDICDGGRTFIELAKAIKADVNYPTNEDRKISLYVTHGIFSAGLEVFDGFIDKIYVSNFMGKPELLDNKLIQLI